MATARTICTRALRRLGVIDALATPSAEDAATTLDALNEMVREWATSGVDALLQGDFALDDAVAFFVPPIDLESASIAVLSYRGVWNASTNSPALASATGTDGHVYRVTVAGSTALDGITAWAVDDYAVFDGLIWLKGISSARFTGGVIAMLATRVAGEFGIPVPADVAAHASSAWASMQTYYVKPPVAGFDTALCDLPSRSSIGWL